MILLRLEIVITRAAPAFRKLFMVMGCVFDINTVHKTIEKLTLQAFYWSSHSHNDSFKIKCYKQIIYRYVALFKLTIHITENIT